ncbi:hypothetical protein M9Y10_014292 [Tritrichomonas musculus]|uniref:Major facilitator superfamily transporter n=1 Tax=Tritrichomonas musculus TaxID=1915356 RepID=A0ABR2KZ70_9EUKA
MDFYPVEERREPLWKWFVGIILLSFITLTTGSPNLYPSQIDHIQESLHISKGLATFMLTGGVMLMYITLPTGVFMDHFGTTITYFISIGITVVSYIALPFCSNIPGLFIFIYLLMAFGSSSMFIVNLEIALSRSPPKIKGFSTSIVSASLSLSFGIFLEIFKVGKKSTIIKCRGYECVFSSFQIVAIVIVAIIVVLSPISFYFFRQFEPEAQEKAQTTMKRHTIFCQFRFYLLLLLMFLTVFDGLLVVSGGSMIWNLYGKGYPNGASDWGIVFSVINCIFTISLSALLDFFLHRFKVGRPNTFGIFWILMGIIPLVVGVLFKFTDNGTLFGIFVSLMGIPFGFGLTQIPAITSDYFGNELFGFIFGLIQIGSIAASACTMPLVQMMKKNDVMITFFVCAAFHLIFGFLLKFIHRIEKVHDDILAETGVADSLNDSSAAL